MAYTTEELGRLIARAHYQAWRLDAPPFDLTPEELAAILPNLIRSGSAGIVWHRVKPVRERYGAMAYALEAATEAQIAHNQKVEEAVVECVTRLRAYGIEPVLVKGLALAKLYPEGIVRPAGDIDLVVRKEEFAAAHAILHDTSRDSISIAIDLKHPDIWRENPHSGFPTSLRILNLASTYCLTIGSYDELRMLTRHFIGHFAFRPVWAVDILLSGTLSDNLPLNQEYLSHNSGGHRCTPEIIMHLAVWQLIGSTATNTDDMPSWLTDAILQTWGLGNGKFPLFRSDVRRIGLIRALRNRWPSALETSVLLDSPFEKRPTLLSRTKAFGLRVRGFLTRI